MSWAIIFFLYLLKRFLFQEIFSEFLLMWTRLRVKCALVPSDFNHKPNLSTKIGKTVLNINFVNIRLAV
jgi:hypothetical protein